MLLDRLGIPSLSFKFKYIFPHNLNKQKNTFLNFFILIFYACNKVRSASIPIKFALKLNFIKILDDLIEFDSLSYISVNEGGFIFDSHTIRRFNASYVPMLSLRI